MRTYMLGLILAPFVALGSPAVANEQPFITAKFYKKNISLEQFRVNPRSYFRSEAAFDLIVDYVGDEIGQNLSGSQFVALMRSDRTRTRACVGTINTGSFTGTQFHWFMRKCRAGEEIVQAKVGDQWVDIFSLNCLNAVEDKSFITPSPVAYTPPPSPPRMVRSTTAIPVNTSVFLAPFMLPGCPSCNCPPAFYSGFSAGSSSVDRSTSFNTEDDR